MATPVKKNRAKGKTAFAKKKAAAKKLTPPDATSVDDFMVKTRHPLKAEMEAVRKIINSVDKRIEERIKWRAPSFYFKDDMVTFNAWAKEDVVHLVFHHPMIVKIKSPLLEGDYDTRRMTYFRSMKEVGEKKKELKRILSELVKMIG